MVSANTFPNIWGPALLACFTVIVGLFYQNARMNDLNARIEDLRDSVNKRFDDMNESFNKRFNDLNESFNKRFDDLTRSVDKRIDDLKDYIGSEFKRVDQRIDRLEIPVGRK